MDKTIKELINHEYYQRLINIEDDIILIYLSGSRAVGSIDEQSDYDISIITKSYQNLEVHEYLANSEGKKIHWYYNSLKTLTCKEYIGKKDLIGMALFNYIDEDLILYKNPEYTECINFLINNKIDIAKHASVNLYSSLKNLINRLREDGCIKKRSHTKLLNDLLVANYIIFQTPPEIEFLNSIKRIKWRPVNESDKQKAYDIIINCENYCNSLQYDRQEESEKLYNALIKYLPGDK